MAVATRSGENLAGGDLAVDVCVIGAGPVGGTLACRLAAAGVTCAVIDRSPLPPMEHPHFDGRAYAIASGSRALLEDAGLWEELPQAPGPIQQIRVSDGRVGRPASPLHLHFDSDAVGGDAFGWMVEARSLRQALNRRLHAVPSITVHAPADAQVTYEATAAAITVTQAGETQRRITARLVVAADGRNSRLRQQAAIPVTRLSYGQTAIVTAITHAVPHHSTALEHFLPGGPFAQLPMAASGQAENVSAIVWTERDPLAERLLAADETVFTRELSRRLGPHLGEIRPIGLRWSYKLAAMHAHRYVAPRLALVGDAAHVIHPIAGQGLNLGLRDVAALADLVIATRAAGGDPGDAALLKTYQRRRRPDNLLMLAATDTLDRLFSNDSRVIRSIRDIGLAGVQRLPRLKALFMRQAMGL
jgi:2-octaprenyl-6-methoxyphenol hydroxylase